MRSDPQFGPRIYGSGQDLRRQMRGLDQVQVELIRQVRLHCAERGALFERCRRQQHEWTVRLMLAVEELQRARDDAAAVAREAAQLQEARLEEQLRLSQTQHTCVHQGGARGPPLSFLGFIMLCLGILSFSEI